MSAAAIIQNLAPLLHGTQLKPLQAPAKRRDRVYAKRVPSCLTPAARAEVVMAARAGRSIHQVAYEHSCAEAVVTELWLRDIERRLMSLARSGALGVLVAAGSAAGVALDAWQATVCGEGAAVQRTFRVRRSRGRRRDGLEDGVQAEAIGFRRGESRTGTEVVWPWEGDHA